MKLMNVRAGLLSSLVLLVGVTACNSGNRDEAYMSAIAAVSASMQDGPGYLLAGVSTDPSKKVAQFDSAALVGPIDPHQLHAFTHRCGACHRPPDPRMKHAYEWDATVAQMERTIANAGLLPIANSDRKTILDFLTQHARRDN
jgi:hypothetical protein